MSGRGGRDRFRRDHPQRSEERRSSAPPSRHLWVGNLSHSVTLNTLTNQFIRFGELENIAFQPGRSYAFVNFIKEEEAISALRALQGFVVAGNPLKIEFTKAVSVHLCLLCSHAFFKFVHLPLLDLSIRKYFVVKPKRNQ